jgi:hypothetical protein
MTKSDRKSLLGKWRITSMEMWGTNYVDMLGPAYIQIDDAGSEMTFAAVQIGLRYEYGETSIWFRFNGSDEMDEVSGDGDAELAENGTLNGEIRFDNDRRKLIYRKTMVNFRSLLVNNFNRAAEPVDGLKLSNSRRLFTCRCWLGLLEEFAQNIVSRITLDDVGSDQLRHAPEPIEAHLGACECR